MRIGHKQMNVLKALGRHGSWHRGCGWYWDTWGGTERAMESLVRRGLVRKRERPVGRSPEYTVTPAGVEVIRGEGE